MDKKGVVGVVSNNGKLLILSKRSDFKDTWHLPSGDVKPNEEPEEAILNRMKEKVDIDIQLKDFIDVLKLPKSSLYFYDCESKTKSVKLNNGSNGFKWIELDKITDFISKDAIEILPTEVKKKLNLHNSYLDF